MYKSIVEGKGGIVARVVAKSASKDSPDSVICTFELEYPRFIHSEIMTHRLFSRNAMSSRAVPITKMIEQVRNKPAKPIHWGANQAGMQAEKEIIGELDFKIDGICFKATAGDFWKDVASKVAVYAEELSNAGLHKQVVNRLLEPFQMMKTVVTATEFDNFFWLRCHSDAQPEIKELAECMYKAYTEAEVEVLKVGEWHTPYVQGVTCQDTGQRYYFTGKPFDSDEITLEEALKVSSSCCAQVSYRLLDNSLDKALKVYDRLVESTPVHASPFEHQASPMKAEPETATGYLENVEGVTHKDQYGNYWSGNFKWWIQYRQMIPNNTCWNYKPD